MQPLSGNQRPGLLTSLTNMSLVLRLPREIHLCRSSSMPHACQRFWKCYKPLTFCSLLARCTTQNDIWHSKVARTCGVLYILTSTCASRHNAVHVFDISTSKSAPRMVCLCILTSTSASCHDGAQFFISHWPDGSAPAALASLLFNPLEPLEKHASAHLHLLSSDSFSSLIFFFLLFFSLTLPTAAFPSVHIVGSSTCKLPSMNETGHKALRAFAWTSRHWQYFWINADMKNHANLGLIDPGLQSCMLQNRVLNLACFIAICHYASTWKLWFWGAPILIGTWLHKVFEKVEHLQHSTRTFLRLPSEVQAVLDPAWKLLPSSAGACCGEPSRATRRSNFGFIIAL